jgi:hypothetical protein
MASGRTCGNHSLDEVLNIAKYNTESLDSVRIPSFGLHSLDLYTLHHRVVRRGTSGFKYAPTGSVRKVLHRF